MSNRKKSSTKQTPQERSGDSIPLALPIRLLAGIAIIVIAVFLVYFPSMSGGFIFDDDRLLTNNRLIRASDGLYRYWCTTDPIDYWPVTNTTLWLEWRLWGMNPTGYHVTNLILHIVETLLIWIILRKLSIPGAFLAAMIFAVHPVNVESVAWIAQRKNTMAMLFFLLSIFCYLKAEIRSPQNHLDSIPYPLSPIPSPVWYWLSLAAFVLAMLSKGSVAVLPVLLLGIVWWLRPLTRWDLVRSVPFFMVAVVLTLVNVWFQRHGLDTVFRTAGFAERLLGAGSVVWFYLYKAFVPIDLVFIYPQWRIESGNPLWWLPLMAVLVVTAVLWKYRETQTRPFLFAWGFFCIALVPVMGFTDVGFMTYTLVADRYQHIAIISVISLAAAGWSIWHQQARTAARRTATVAIVVGLGTLAFLTLRQNELYRDKLTLYQITVDKNPDCWLAQYNLGNAFSAIGQYQRAVEHYQHALQFNPKLSEAHNNLGNALVIIGRLQEAMEHFHQSLKLQPNNSAAEYNLGAALAQTGRLQEAIEHFEQSLRFTPNSPDTHLSLGNTLIQTGRPQEAIEHFEQALRLNPNYPEAYNNLGISLFQTDRPQEAIRQYENALRLKPNYAEAHNNLGSALAQTGHPQEAIDHFKQALRLKPDYVNAYNSLALVYAGLHQPTEAIGMAQKALEVARSLGQTAQARQIEDWLKSYQDGLSK